MAGFLCHCVPTIPKGVEHKPSSENGYKALLIEPEDVPNTGNVRSEITIEKIEWV